MQVRPYSLKNLRIDPGLVLSPMSGVTNCAFRVLIKELNPSAVGLMISEFISVEALTRRIPRALAMMRFKEMERPIGLQIFGYDIERMCEAARMCQDTGVDVIDINCGCPAPKVVRKGGGCELMRQPLHLGRLIRAVRSVLTVPLTIKMRAGWDDATRNAVEIARLAESEGVDAIAVHGRTRAQLYRGDADWNLVREVKEAVRVPVLGSGDVVSAEGAAERLALGIDGLFLGRGALQNPLVFTSIVRGELVSLRQDAQAAVRVINRYIELLLEELPERACVGKVKQLASQMCRGFTWRKPLLLAGTLAGQQEVLRTASCLFPTKPLE